MIVNKVDEDCSYSITYTHKKYRNICDRLLQLPFDSYKVSRKYHDQISNRAVNEGKALLFNDFGEYAKHTLPSPISKLIEKVTGFKSGICFPMFNNNTPIGTIIYSQDYDTDFSEIYSLLEALTKNIEVAICNAMKFEELINRLNSSK